VVTWDDHEVENDYQGLTPVEGGEPVDFAARRSAGYQAYYEHLPLRAASIPDDGQTRIFRRLRWGSLASFSVLDTRQYRTNAACGDGESPRCAAALDPAQTMTGPAQERWLLRGLDASRAQWNLIAQQVLMAELDHEIAPDAKRFWNDAWDGYPAARARILQHLHSREIANPVVLTGDWHSTFANDVKLDFDDPASPTVASEFVTPSITTGGDATPYGPYYGPMVPFNRHIRFFDGDRRGSLVARLSRERLEVDWRVAASVGTPDAPVWPLRQFAVEAGRPGVQV
jgi:alkaline phosphatase D